MPTEHDDAESAASDIAALSETALEHFQQGRLRQAREICESILRNEQRPVAVLILAKIAHKQGEFEEAIECYEHFLRMVPEHGASHFHLGIVLDECGQTEPAIEHYEESIRLGAAKDSVYRRLGNALLQLGRLHEAVGCLERAVALQPDDVATLISLARTWLQLGRAEEAIAPLEQAVNVEPDDSEANIGLALALRQTGRTEQAAQQLERLLARVPACGEAHYQLSMIKPESRHIAAVENALRDPGLSTYDAVYCHFALGNLLQRNESFDQAFDHFRKANSLHRESFEYDARQHSHTIDRLIRTYSKSFFEDKRNFGSDSELPVFVVGMPRSGTTLVEQILSSHPLVHGAGELDTIRGINQAIAQRLCSDEPPPACMSHIDRNITQKYAAAYLQELARHCPTAARITDKLPGNYVATGLIKTLLPQARIVHCRRNALDNCISLYLHCFPLMTSSFDLTELGHYYLDYQRLMSHWQSLFPGEIFTVDYEDLVSNQETVSRQLVDYIGLDWDDRCLDFQNNDRNVSTPSNMQVRQPIYKSSVNKWMHYERHLQPLIDVLAAEPGR